MTAPATEMACPASLPTTMPVRIAAAPTIMGNGLLRARPALLGFRENRADVYLSIGTDHDVGEKFGRTHFSDDGMTRELVLGA